MQFTLLNSTNFENNKCLIYATEFKNTIDAVTQGFLKFALAYIEQSMKPSAKINSDFNIFDVDNLKLELQNFYGCTFERCKRMQGLASFIMLETKTIIQILEKEQIQL